jgi:hypothetical protein
MFAIGLVVFGLSAFCCGVLVAGRLYRAAGKRNSQWEDVDPMSFARRAEAAHMRHREIIEESKKAEGDPEKFAALEAESELILKNVRDIRLEQMECQEHGWRRLRETADGRDPRDPGQTEIRG